MKVITEIESVNLSNGDRTRRVVGDGESRIERSRGFVDEVRLGPSQNDVNRWMEDSQPRVDEIIQKAKELLTMNATRCKMRLVSISGGYYGTTKAAPSNFAP